ncbi:MBL fold metallo-hydrolase [Parvibaculaceae bacterium PLY_AMNH_Bact1]|nr:MBL fold metallo-hydrolase [Parvibaculaceae bacterium PLY_AMNH_Bact1]
MPAISSTAAKSGTRSVLKPDVLSYFDEPTNTITHIVTDPETGSAAIIDPVLDFDQASARTGTKSADRLIETVKDKNLKVEWILETHIHADHLTAGHYLKEQLNAPIGVGRNISTVQKTFNPVFHQPYPVPDDGRPFDHLFTEGEKFRIGTLEASVMATPGHTPACVSFLIGDSVFVGDTLFMPDYGTARCDFPGGDAGMLYDSIERLLNLPDNTRMFLCHDYPPAEREPKWETTVGEQRNHNIHIANRARDAFVEMREDRDSGLNMPQLIFPSLQVNIQAGELPHAEENGVQYLKVPLNQF